VNPATSESDAQVRAALTRVRRVVRLTDTGLRIPFTEVRFGLDPLLGLIPVVGDLAGLALSLYIYREAHNLGAPPSVRRRMIRNMGVDLGGGFLPVVGDVFDFAWWANSRNARLLLDWAEETSGHQDEKLAYPGWWLMVFALCLAALVWFFRPGAAGPV
jgi:hypothetical protein